MRAVEPGRRMRIDAPTISWDGEYALVSSTFHIDDRAISLWFRTKGSPINFGAAQDAFLACTLIPAMRIGGTLVVESAVSPQLLKSITTIQQIIAKWYSSFHIIDVVADNAANREIEKAPTRSAQFFSGGVDSFYTMLKNRDEIQDLYFVRGFDLFLNMKSSLNLASRQAKGAADAFGKNLIEIETNLHDFSREFVLWPNHYHGSAMAAMALLMSARNPRFYFAATHSYADMFPWGSHPLLDSLWSTEYLEVIHDGAEATRLEKTFSIVKEPAVLKYLNVGCGGADCRRTEKCLRTMIALDLAGVLDQCKTFGHPLEIKDVENIKIMGDNGLSFVMENFRELMKRPDKKELRRALRIAIKNFQNKKIAHSLRKNMNSLKASPHFELIQEMAGIEARSPCR